MNSNLISPRRHIDRVSYSLVCERVDASGRVIERGMGFRFDCDASGNVNEGKMFPAGLANLRGIRSGAIPCTPLEVESRAWVEHIPAVCRCDCGRSVTLCDSWANSCDCGAEFNGSGQLLAPRSQWGEETGEQGTF